MGRLRIKKKEATIPFRETLAYRMFLLTGSVVLLLIALYVSIGAMTTSNTVSLVASALIGVSAAFAVFYNLNHLSDARVSQRTLKRMKRR